MTTYVDWPEPASPAGRAVLGRGWRVRAVEWRGAPGPEDPFLAGAAA